MGIQPPEGMVEREIRVEPGEFIACIIGPRRAGKTTFMLQLMRDSKLPESNRVFINARLRTRLSAFTGSTLARALSPARAARPRRGKER